MKTNFTIHISHLSGPLHLKHREFQQSQINDGTIYDFALGERSNFHQLRLYIEPPKAPYRCEG